MYLFPCSRLYSPQYLDLVPTRSIISGMLLAKIACKYKLMQFVQFFFLFKSLKLVMFELVSGIRVRLSVELCEIK